MMIRNYFSAENKTIKNHTSPKPKKRENKVRAALENWTSKASQPGYSTKVFDLKALRFDLERIPGLKAIAEAMD